MSIKETMIEATKDRVATVMDRFYVHGSDGYMMLSFAPAGTEVTRAKSDSVEILREDVFVIGWSNTQTITAGTPERPFRQRKLTKRSNIGRKYRRNTNERINFKYQNRNRRAKTTASSSIARLRRRKPSPNTSKTPQRHLSP